MALALSIRQPWAWLILHAGKDVENRSWWTRVHGRILIHASKGMTLDEWTDGFAAARSVLGDNPRAIDLTFPAAAQLQRGGIVGEAEIVDCVTLSRSPWFVGPYGFVLRNARPLPFMPCKGRLGFFEVDDGDRA